MTDKMTENLYCLKGIFHYDEFNQIWVLYCVYTGSVFIPRFGLIRDRQCFMRRTCDSHLHGFVTDGENVLSLRCLF